MIVVRVVAVLLIIAFALVLLFLWSRNRRYLQWAWRVFLMALFVMLGLMVFYFVERLQTTLAPLLPTLALNEVSKC
jgi:hypothetical protein